IAAVGVKLRRWVSFHGVSLNVEPDLGHFAGIVPCGQTEHGVTSLVDLGLPVTMDEADDALKTSFRDVFGPVEDSAPPVCQMPPPWGSCQRSCLGGTLTAAACPLRRACRAPPPPAGEDFEVRPWR